MINYLAILIVVIYFADILLFNTFNNFTLWMFLSYFPIILFINYRIILNLFLPYASVGSLIVLIGYITFLFGNPELEWDLAEKHNLTKSFVISRSIVLHVLPFAYFFYLTKINLIKSVLKSLIFFIMVGLYKWKYSEENPYKIYKIYKYSPTVFELCQIGSIILGYFIYFKYY